MSQASSARMHNAYITRVRKNLSNRLREAIELAPCSVRSLAKAAGVSPAILQHIRSGLRAATPDVAERVAAALEHWGARCVRLAAHVRKAVKTVPTLRTTRRRS